MVCQRETFVNILSPLQIISPNKAVHLVKNIKIISALRY